jgi:hypothetical protein
MYHHHRLLGLVYICPVFTVQLIWPTNRRSNTLVKVKLSLCLINYKSWPEDIPGSGGIAPPFLTSASDGVKRSASRPGHFNPGK